jgi:hypothetical protein
MGVVYRIYIDGRYFGAGFTRASAREGAKKMLSVSERIREKELKARRRCPLCLRKCPLYPIGMSALGQKRTFHVPAMSALPYPQLPIGPLRASSPSDPAAIWLAPRRHDSNPSAVTILRSATFRIDDRIACGPQGATVGRLPSTCM